MVSCNQCGRTFSRKDHLVRHLRQSCSARLSKEVAGSSNETPSTSKRARKDETIIHCDVCSKDISRSSFKSHVRTLEHKEKACRPGSQEGVEIIRSSFKNNIISYRFCLPDHLLQVREVLMTIKNKIENVTVQQQKEMKNMKVNFELFGLYFNERSHVTNTKSFQTKYAILTQGTDFDGLYEDLVDIVDRKESEFLTKDSGVSHNVEYYILLKTHLFQDGSSSTFVF